MRRTKPMRIGELWSDFKKESPWVARKMAEAQVGEVWAKMVGLYVASQTTSLEVKNGVLTVVIASSVARQEIFMQRDALKEVINRELGMDVVRVVIVK